jgi:hypothetical protein
MMKNIARRYKIAADLFVTLVASVTIVLLFWAGQYVFQQTSAEIIAVDVYTPSGVKRTEKKNGLQVAKAKDTITLTMRFAGLPSATFRSDQVIVDCGETEYTVHSTIKQTKPMIGNSRSYGITYPVPYASCQGNGIMFTRVELVDKFNLLMTIFPMTIESNKIPMYFTR